MRKTYVSLIGMWFYTLASAQPITIKDVSPNTFSYPLTNVNHAPGGLVLSLSGSADGQRLYAGAYTGLWRSDNSGYTWYQLTWPQPPSFTNAVPGALEAEIMMDIIVSPSNKDVVLVMAKSNTRTTTNNRNGIYRSQDGGYSWQHVLNVSATGGQVVFAPDDHQLLYAAIGNNIYISRDEGLTWEGKPQLRPVHHIVAGKKENSRRDVYALGQSGMIISQNGGDTWFLDQTTTMNNIIGWPAVENSGTSSQIMVIVPGTRTVLVASASRTSGPIFWRNNPLLDPDGATCNTNIIYDLNGNNIVDLTDIKIYAQPVVPVAALKDEPRIKYYDVNNNNVWNLNEIIVYDGNMNSIRDATDIQYSGVDLPLGTVLKDDPKIMFPDNGTAFGIPCSDGSIWKGDYSAFDTTSTNTRRSTWSAVHGPPVFRVTDSGNGFLYSKETADGLLLFFSDKNYVFVCKGVPTGAASWHCLTAKDVSAIKLAGESNTTPWVHWDPHCIFVPDNFDITLKDPVNVSYPYNQNKVLDRHGRGMIWVGNDGGVYRSGNAGETWSLGNFLSLLQPINVAVLSRTGKKPALYFGGAHNDDFYSLDGGGLWDDPLSGCGDCDVWFADPALPNQVLSFQPRAKRLELYIGNNNFPDAKQNSQLTIIPIAEKSNAVSFYAVRGYRPLILTLQNEPAPGSLDLILIRYNSSGKKVLLRTNNLASISSEGDWFDPTIALEVGPPLPFADSSCPGDPLCSAVVQASGGHSDPVYYLSFPERFDKLWKWKQGMREWQQLIPTPSGSITSIERFYVNPYLPNQVYIITKNNGVFRSEDGGMSWTAEIQINNMVTENGIFSWQGESDGDRALIHEIIFSRSEPGTKMIFANSGIFYATNNNSWQRLISTTALPSRPASGIFDFVTDHCDRTVYVATRGRGLLKIGNLPGPVHKINITQLTDATLNGPLTSWQTKNGPYNVEHLAGVASNGDLLTFVWSPQHNWIRINISQIMGRKLNPGAAVTSWQTKNGPYTVEHLAGVASNGDLLTFVWSPQHNWQAINVSQISGVKLQPGTAVTSWQTKNGPYNVEHLAGVNASGSLFVFIWSPQHNWQAINVSQKTTKYLSIGSGITSWQTKNGIYNVEHLAGVAANGDLLTFVWSPRRDWIAINISAITGQALDGNSAITSWQTKNGIYNVEHIAGVTQTGDMLAFWWSPLNNWQFVNVSYKTNTKADPRSVVSWQTNHCNKAIEHLASVTPSGDAISFWWTGSTDWRKGNLSNSTSQRLTQLSTVWQTPDGSYNIEHFGGVFNNQLWLFYTRNSAFE